jgi:hypothetical protein
MIDLELEAGATWSYLDLPGLSWSYLDLPGVFATWSISAGSRWMLEDRARSWITQLEAQTLDLEAGS